MLEVGGNLDFGKEAIDADHRTQVGAQYFERNAPIVPRIAREVHRRHAAPADLSIDRVSSVERPVELGDEVHRSVASGRKAVAEKRRASRTTRLGVGVMGNNAQVPRVERFLSAIEEALKTA